MSAHGRRSGGGRRLDSAATRRRHRQFPADRNKHTALCLLQASLPDDTASSDSSYILGLDSSSSSSNCSSRRSTPRSTNRQSPSNSPDDGPSPSYQQTVFDHSPGRRPVGGAGAGPRRSSMSSFLAHHAGVTDVSPAAAAPTPATSQASQASEPQPRSGRPHWCRRRPAWQTRGTHPSPEKSPLSSMTTSGTRTMSGRVQPRKRKTLAGIMWPGHGSSSAKSSSSRSSGGGGSGSGGGPWGASSDSQPQAASPTEAPTARRLKLSQIVLDLSVSAAQADDDDDDNATGAFGRRKLLRRGARAVPVDAGSEASDIDSDDDDDLGGGNGFTGHAGMGQPALDRPDEELEDFGDSDNEDEDDDGGAQGDRSQPAGMLSHVRKASSHPSPPQNRQQLRHHHHHQQQQQQQQNQKQKQPQPGFAMSSWLCRVSQDLADMDSDGGESGHGRGGGLGARGAGAGRAPLAPIGSPAAKPRAKARKGPRGAGGGAGASSSAHAAGSADGLLGAYDSPAAADAPSFAARLGKLQRVHASEVARFTHFRRKLAAAAAAASAPASSSSSTRAVATATMTFAPNFAWSDANPAAVELTVEHAQRFGNNWLARCRVTRPPAQQGRRPQQAATIATSVLPWSPSTAAAPAAVAEVLFSASTSERLKLRVGLGVRVFPPWLVVQREFIVASAPKHHGTGDSDRNNPAPPSSRQVMLCTDFAVPCGGRGSL